MLEVSPNEESANKLKRSAALREGPRTIHIRTVLLHSIPSVLSMPVMT